MLYIQYLRRRLIIVGLGMWITTLVFAYSFLAEDAEYRSRAVAPTQQETKMMDTGRRHVPSTWQDVRLKFKPLGYSDGTRRNLADRKSSRESPIDALSPIHEYCNHGEDLSSSQEGYLDNRDYDLLSVHVITRHGDRAPMYSFSRHPNPKLSCRFDPEEIKSVPVLSSFVETMKQWEGQQKMHNRFKGWAIFPNRKICDSSQLTPTGSKQMLNLGFHLHERYVQRWGLLDGVTPGQLNIHTTEYPKTYQSAISLLYGVLPNFNLTDIPILKASNYFFCSEQTVSGPCACPALASLRREADITVSNLVKNATRFRNLLNSIAEIYVMNNNRLPWMWAMMDVFLGHVCNAVKLPCNGQGHCVTSGMVAELWDHVAKYIGNLTELPAYHKYASLALHPLLNDLLDKMNDARPGDNHVRLNLYSGHGSTLIPLTVLLGIGGNNWPKYASRLVFELYWKRDTHDRHIRILYNDKDITSETVFCQGAVENGLCPLKQFENFVINDNLGQYRDNDYINLCYNAP